MFHACIKKFDVTENIQKILGTKQGLNFERLKRGSWDPWSCNLLPRPNIIVHLKFEICFTKNSYFDFTTIKDKSIRSLLTKKGKTER